MLLLLFSFGCEQVIVPVSREIHFDCGASYNPDATDITAALEYGESRLLERFPNLSSVNLTGSEDVAEVRAFAAAHPEISVRCDLSLLGQTVAFDATTLTDSSSYVVSDIQHAINALPNLTKLDLRACKLDNISLLQLIQDNPALSIQCMAEVFGAFVDNQTTTLAIHASEAEFSEIGGELSRVLGLFPALQSVDLTQLEEALTPETILSLQQEFPSLEIVYAFRLFGREIKTTDTELDLYEVRVKNEGVPELEKVLACMPNCTYADMAYTKVDNETMAALAAKFPKIKFSWMIHFAAYSCRTDANMLKVSKPFYGFTSNVAEILKYCTDLEYLDIGHNQLTNLDFLSHMKNLKVLIAAISFNITDISPVANCTQLEYLELFSNRIVDVSPLLGLTQLKHLNICNNRIVDATPLYSLQNLERLWIANNPLSDAQKTQLVANLPNCLVNVTTGNPTAEGWKKGARYDLLTQQFHYGSPIIYERFGDFVRP